MLKSNSSPLKFPSLFQKMPLSLPRLSNSIPFSRLFRQLEQEMETIAKVLQPGPLGIVEHKFSAEEISESKATVDKAVKNWRQNAILEKKVVS